MNTVKIPASYFYNEYLENEDINASCENYLILAFLYKPEHIKGVLRIISDRDRKGELSTVHDAWLYKYLGEYGRRLKLDANNGLIFDLIDTSVIN